MILHYNLQHTPTEDITSASFIVIEIDGQPTYIKDFGNDRDLNPQGLPLLQGEMNTIVLSLHVSGPLADPLVSRRWESLSPAAMLPMKLKVFSFANDSISLLTCIKLQILKPTPVFVFKRWW